MDLCLIFRREKLGIFCFLLLLEDESLESIVLDIEDREPQPRRLRLVYLKFWASSASFTLTRTMNGDIATG